MDLMRIASTIESASAHQPTSRFSHDLLGFISGVRHRGQMSHLATDASGRRAVQMQFDFGHLERGFPVRFAVLPDIAEQICHRGGSQQFR